MTIPFAQWLSDLRALFPVAEEYELAAAIYDFERDCDIGLSPKQSYQAFDDFVGAEA